MNKFINVSYCIGAAIVIIGAMGKLIHYSWSDIALQIGLIIEAFIFILQGFQVYKEEEHTEGMMKMNKVSYDIDVKELQTNINVFSNTLNNVNNKFQGIIDIMKK